MGLCDTDYQALRQKEREEQKLKQQLISRFNSF